MRAAILVSAAMNRDAFPSTEAVWIQLYDVVHPKYMHGSGQPYKDQGANWPFVIVVG